MDHACEMWSIPSVDFLLTLVLGQSVIGSNEFISENCRAVSHGFLLLFMVEKATFSSTISFSKD
jgi:hypothetical protein